MEPQEWALSPSTPSPRQKHNCHHLKMEQAVVKVPRPQISTTEHLQSQEQETCQHRKDKKVEETRKKSTCQDLRRGECDERRYCDPGASLACCLITTPGLKPDRPVQHPVLFELETYANNFPRREKMMTRVTVRKTCLTPCRAQVLLDNYVPSERPQCKHHSQFLLEEQVIPVIIRYIQNGMSCFAKRRFSSRRSSLFWHFTKLTSLWLMWSVV